MTEHGTRLPGQDDFVPALHADFVRRDLGTETVVWSQYRPAPTALDPVAAVMLDVIDGTATVEELAEDVRSEVGVPLDVARAQVERVVDLFDRIGLLQTSDQHEDAVESIRRRRLFVNPTSY